MQDVEFTVERGKLWMLQCQSGKPTGATTIKIAIDLENDGICSPAEALLKVDPDHVRQLLHPHFSANALKSEEYSSGVVAAGLPGGPGAAVGKLVFTPKEAKEHNGKDEDVILVQEMTSPEDVGGMWAAAGILTTRGGMTSHAAIMARGWSKPCICGCSDLEVSKTQKTVTIKSTDEIFKAGDVISINGSTGEVIRGTIPVEMPTLEGNLGIIMDWADAQPGAMKVMINADSVLDAAQAASHGSVGVGPCRRHRTHVLCTRSNDYPL
jgi:pyruvate,orthophosphate dikinase